MTFNDETEVEDETLDSPEEEVEVEETETEEEEESVDDLRARLQKAEELANNYKIRAEKAEKKPKAPSAVATASGLSTADIVALTRANINDEDIDEVIEYAKIKKLSVSEALKSDIIQATIKIRDEKRASAQAVHTGVTRKAPSGTSDERLLDNARNGKLPDSESDIAKLVELRIKNKHR